MRNYLVFVDCNIFACILTTKLLAVALEPLNVLSNLRKSAFCLLTRTGTYYTSTMYSHILSTVLDLFSPQSLFIVQPKSEALHKLQYIADQPMPYYLRITKWMRN